MSWHVFITVLENCFKIINLFDEFSLVGLKGSFFIGNVVQFRLFYAENADVSK